MFHILSRKREIWISISKAKQKYIIIPEKLAELISSNLIETYVRNSITLLLREDIDHYFIKK